MFLRKVKAISGPLGQNSDTVPLKSCLLCVIDDLSIRNSVVWRVLVGVVSELGQHRGNLGHVPKHGQSQTKCAGMNTQVVLQKTTIIFPGSF